MPRQKTSHARTLAGIANCGPDSDGFLYIGIADKDADADRIKALDGIDSVKFEHVQIVGIEREAKALSMKIEDYVRLVSNAIANSKIGEPLKTQILSHIDLVSYRGLAVIRIAVRRQSAPTFVGDDCFIRANSSTHKATGPQIAAVAKLFS